MKSKNNTWLDFFKKTLKISGIILLILVILVAYLIYRGATHDSKTYLSCINDETKKIYNIAFNDYRLFRYWDPLNEKFEESFDIIEINKKFIKARSYAEPNNEHKSMSLSNTKGTATKVYELIWELDRETGKIKAYFSDYDAEVNDDGECKKIDKKDLPITKVEQKF